MEPLLILLGAFLLAHAKAILAVPFPELMGETAVRHEVGWDIQLAPIDEVKQ